MAAADTRIRVWDPAVRIFHWALAVGFLTAYVTEGDMPVHAWAGYSLVALLLFRLLWGFVGPGHARFADFMRSPREVLGHLKAMLRLREPRYLGHNPAGGAMALALLALIAATAGLGLVLYGVDEGRGPLAALAGGLSESGAHWLEEAHEVFANATLAFVLLHLGGVLWESLRHRENLIGAMISGRKRGSVDQV
ncbi:MAG: cytochrome B [Gammaproteobacteria bacterium]|jgi:cytochrome b|nr:cytochrome B [Gammaproteobacteria bacterium]